MTQHNLAVASPAEPIGLIHDLDIEAYHSGPGISKTGLTLMARSPAHYFAAYLDPNRPPAKARAGHLEGSLAHCAILEPAEFDKRYVVIPPDAPRRPSVTQINAKNPSPETIAAIDWWDDFNAKHGNAEVITYDQRETALRQADSVRRLPDVLAALDRGHPEVSAFWRDEATGELCRVRPDWVHDASATGSILFDVKTYSDASPNEFRRQIARKDYHVQDAYYSDGYAKASGKSVLGFVFVAVEMEYPFAACAVMLDQVGRSIGRADYRSTLDLYHLCRVRNEWPGYSDTIELVSLPSYLTNGRD